MAVEVPIRANVPAQTFDIVLDGVSYTMVAKWNSRSTFWTLDILQEDQSSLILGVCLKLGARLLQQFNLNIGDFIMIDDTGTGQEASLSNIGISTRLVYFTSTELEALAA